MRHVVPFLLVLSLVPCSLGGGGKPEEQPESRIDYEPISTFRNNVLTIDATQRDGTRIRLNTLRDGLGCEGDNEVRRLHVASAFKTFEPEGVELLAHPRDYELHLAPTSFNPDGAFDTDEGVAVTHPQRSKQQVHGGFWGGGISSRRDSAGNPPMVSGIRSASFAEADGRASYFTAIFNVLSEDFRAANAE